MCWPNSASHLFDRPKAWQLVVSGGAHSSRGTAAANGSLFITLIPSPERFATVCNYVQHFKDMPRYSERVEAFCCWGDNPQREGEVNVYAKEAPFSFSRKQEEQSHFYSCRNSAYFHPFAIRTT